MAYQPTQKSLLHRFLDFWQLSPVSTSESLDSSAYRFSELGKACPVDEAMCPHRRRFLPAYQRRLKVVRDAWLMMLSILLFAQAAAPLIISSVLFSTFLSFAFLDETPFPQVIDG